jgi:hypothetical protein
LLSCNSCGSGHAEPRNAAHGGRRNGGLCYFGIDVASCVYKADTGSIMIPLRLRRWLSGSYRDARCTEHLIQPHLSKPNETGDHAGQRAAARQGVRTQHGANWDKLPIETGKAALPLASVAKVSVRKREMRNDNRRRIVLDIRIERRFPMPTSLQYPLELDRRLLRRWQLLRTATPIKGAAIKPPNAILSGKSSTSRGLSPGGCGATSRRLP